MYSNKPSEAHSTHPDSEFLEILRRSTDQLIVGESVTTELFSVEQFEKYAELLAGALPVSPIFRRKRSLLPDLKKSGQKLVSAYNQLAGAIQNKQTLSPAA